MSQKPRTPQHFPNMKVRGARRRRIASGQRLSGLFVKVATSARVEAGAMDGFAALRRMEAAHQLSIRQRKSAEESVAEMNAWAKWTQ